jgi:hypothetical protein
MAVLKYYDGSDWEPVASALVGPTGSTGVTGSTGPTGPNPGLTLIKTETFSAVSSVSVDNVFSATYDNYFLTGNISTTGGDASLRWRVGGADNSTSNYQYGLARKDFGGATFTNDTQSTTATSTFGATNPGTNISGFWRNINNPFASQRTTSIGHTISSSSYAYYDSHLFNATTSFTGFTLLCSGAFTMTGNVSIYGYNK